jgi:hypothetical protein
MPCSIARPSAKNPTLAVAMTAAGKPLRASSGFPGVEGEDSQLLRAQPSERLLAHGVEGPADTLGEPRLVGRTVVGNHQRVGVAPPHVDLGVDCGDAVAYPRRRRLDDPPANGHLVGDFEQSIARREFGKLLDARADHDPRRRGQPCASLLGQSHLRPYRFGHRSSRLPVVQDASRNFQPPATWCRDNGGDLQLGR